jgi:hypothetical protein
MTDTPIQNFLYPRPGFCADSEIFRLDGPMLAEGYIILNGKEYTLRRRRPPEYSQNPERMLCSWVRYRWNYSPSLYGETG